MPITQTQSPPAELITRKLFESFHAGFGDSDALVEAGRSPSRYNRIHGSIDARWPRQLRGPGMKVEKIASPAHDLNPIFSIAWADTNGIYPVIYYIVGKQIRKVLFGVNTEVGADALGSSNCTGGMFDDDGSGIPYLYACFGATAASAKIRRMNLAQTVTTSADVYAGLLLSLNGKAYRTVTPTSGTAACQVSVCPYGSSRFVVSAWGTAITVGFAGTDINTLAAVRQAPVAIKPEGIFAYNAGLDQWVNYTPSWRRFMHLNNGKGAYYLGDKLVIPMGDGGAVIFDGNNVSPFDPGTLLSTPNVHTTRDNFEAGSMTAMRHWILGATGCPSKLISAGTSLRFFYTVDDAAFTDESADVRDLDLTTNATLPANAALKIYIGWDRPFSAIRFDTGDPNTTARTMTVKVGTAASTFTTVGAKNTGFRDFSELAGAPLGQSGPIVLMVDPVDSIGWIKNTINSVEAYWMQLTFSGAFDSTVTWLTCQIQPWYPSTDFDNFPLDGIDKSGNLPHLLFGRGGQNGEALWHDMFSLSEPDAISQMLFGSSGGSSLNHSRQLTLLGRFGTWIVSIADNDRPGTEAAPFLNSVGLIEAASMDIVPGKIVRFKTLRINGHEFDPDKIGAFFYWAWDWGNKWSRFGSRAFHVPVEMDNPYTQDMGMKFRWALGFKQSASQATLTQPVVTDIEADFEIVTGVSYTQLVQRKLQAEPRF